MSKLRVTKHAIQHRTRGGLPFTIPAGALVKPIPGQPGRYWVDPTTFPAYSIERHDAIYYGVSVSHDETKKKPD